MIGYNTEWHRGHADGVADTKRHYTSVLENTMVQIANNNLLGYTFTLEEIYADTINHWVIPEKAHLLREILLYFQAEEAAKTKRLSEVAANG